MDTMSNIRTAKKYIGDVQGVLREALDKLDIINESSEDCKFEDVCHQILEQFTGSSPSVGDVQNLKDKLTHILIVDFGVPKSRLE